MKLRLPAYPIMTVDPYFNIWSFSDRLNDSNTVHWTGKPNILNGFLIIGEKRYSFLGRVEGAIPMEQTGIEVTALSTAYKFEYEGIKLTATFTSALLSDDIELLSRPVSYLEVSVEGVDSASVCVKAEESLCLNERGQYKVKTELVKSRYPMVCMGSVDQPVLKSSGDDIRIDYGYLYVGSFKEDARVFTEKNNTATYIGCETKITDGKAIFVFAYDDIASIEYFGEACSSVWNKDGESIVSIIEKSICEYADIKKRCSEFDDKLWEDATKAGGEKYADLLTGVYRQVMAAHKTVVDKEGNLLWVSKECFSNGCASTVDVSYPSSPIFMLYNTELLKGMLRPVFRYAESDKWNYDFAPHDVGTYPLLNGQTYYDCALEYQMPVEECGNMLVLASAVALLEKNGDFINAHKETLEIWAGYLMRNGFDPADQLCTDDFAGHLAHNCNLSVKAICGLGAYGKACEISGDTVGAENYSKKAKEMAREWLSTKRNSDGSFPLAFDQPETFSMKYNLVWDEIMGLNLFDREAVDAEIKSYKKHINRYGMPLDNRENYTKSDWLLWCASLYNTKEEFEEFIAPLWDAYNETVDRAPMTDWYYTDTAKKQLFQNRTVQGGLWIHILKKKNIFGV